MPAAPPPADSAYVASAPAPDGASNAAPSSSRAPAASAAPVEVTVQGQRAAPGAEPITRASARELPGAFGDPLRAVEAEPGVTPIVSGLPSFFVRGAPHASVGIYIDGI